MNQGCCDYRIKIMIIISDYFHWIVKVMIKLLIFFKVIITITITFTLLHVAMSFVSHSVTAVDTAAFSDKSHVVLSVM